MKFYLREYREQCGLTIEGLSALVGTSEEDVALLESGETTPDVAQIQLLAAGLDLHPEDLFGDAPWEEHQRRKRDYAERIVSLEAILLAISCRLEDPFTKTQATYLASIIMRASSGHLLSEYESKSITYKAFTQGLA